MGSFFNGGSRNKPRYERLPLDTFFPSGSTITRTHEHHDDLDEDNLLFDLDNQASQNGRLLSAKNGYDSEEEIEFYKDTRRSRDRRSSPPSSCCCLVCLLVVLVLVALLFGALYLIRPRAQNTAGRGWTSSTYEYATETAMRLYDVNQDGIEDVILGAAVTSSLQDIENEIEFCRKHDMVYPCAGLIMALDGRNGTRLWTIYTKVEVFAIQCGKLDINQDGHMDCVAAGRMATLHGIDPIKGVILWSADPSVTNPHFNFYQGQVVPDLDQDSVQDFVVTHGGDTRFSEKELDRPAGRLLLLSGKTGRSLGRYLSLPDEHETYSAITLYTRHNGAVYLLFGSGGETIAGSLWTISLRDLYCYVMSITTCSADSLSHVIHLQNKGYEESWGTPIQTLSSGAKEIIRSDSSKGVTVPTELVDMNNDGVEDLVVFMYNSTITVLNGLNLEVIWSTGSRFVEFETYSNPAPGYFNDDDTVDLMVRLSKGTWPNFKSTYVYILDGRNGEILWYLKTPSIGPVMSSPLTLQSYGRKDAFIFWAQGLSGEIRGEGLEPPGHEMGPEMGPDMGPETGSDMGPELGSEMGSVVGSEGVVDSSAPQGRPRRHGGMGPDQPCLLSMDVFRADLLLVDRDLALKPLRLASIEAYKYNYSLTEEDRLLLKEKLHDDQDLGAMETVPPDTHVTPPSKSAPPPTKAMVTEEDLARHDLHRHMTTSANAVTTPEDVDLVTEAVVLPEGLEPTTIADSIPEDIGPSTVAGTLPEGLESTIKALTSPEGQESRAAMGTSEIIEETTLRQEAIQTSSVGEVVELSTPSTTSLVKDIETSTLLPTDDIFSTSSENSTPMSTNSETTTKTLETTVSGVSTTFETTGTPREEITTVSMPETTTPLDLATDLLEATTEGSQTATETATPPDVTASASTLGLETSSLEATATSELATQSTQPPTTEFEDYLQRSTSESETGTLSVDDTTPPMEINSGPQAVNSSSPQAVNSSIPQAVNSSSPQAVNSNSPQAVNSSSPQAVNSSSPQAVNSSSPQAVNSSSPQAVSSSSPQAVNSSSPQAVSSSSPQAVNSSSPQAVNSNSPQAVNSSGPQAVNSSSPQAVNSNSSQAVNSNSPQAVNSSSPQAVNSSSPQAVNSSSPQAVNSSSPQAVSSSSPQAVNSSSPQAVNSSSPLAVNFSIPLAVNLTHTSSSNNKSDTDTNEPASLPVSQGTNHSSEESHIETTDDDENTEPSPKEEITNNNQSTTHLAELFTELGMVAEQETSTPQKPETPSKPASGSEGGEEHRRRRETSGSDLCLVYQPSLFGTGIIGDLDNDGNLDYVYVETQMAQLTDEDSHYLTTKLRLRVHRLVLKSAITRRDWVRLEDDQVVLSEGVSREEVDVEELEEHFRFLPADKQSWTSYMGKNGDEKFRKNNR